MIDLVHWEPYQGNMKPAGQRTAYEVYIELKNYLESINCLPDGSLLLDYNWTEGKLIPPYARIFTTVGYGKLEGIDLKINLTCFENGRFVSFAFIEGKTLGESSADMDRMHLISSAITQAFYTERIHANYMVTGIQKEIIILPHAKDLFDIASHAISEDNIRQLDEILSVVETHRKMHLKLLVQAAGKPGPIGRSMVLSLMENVRNIENNDYKLIYQAAVQIRDTYRVNYLLDHARRLISYYPLSLNGEIMYMSMLDEYRPGTSMANDIFFESGPDQREAIPSKTMLRALELKDTDLACRMLRAGAALVPDTNEIVYQIAANCPGSLQYMKEALGVDLCDDNCYALRRCVYSKHPFALDCLVAESNLDFEAFYLMMSAEQLDPESRIYLEAKYAEYYTPQQTEAEDVIQTIT